MVWPSAIALAVAISTVARMTMMALLFKVSMTTTITVVIIMWHDTGTERHCHHSQHQNNPFFHRISLMLICLAMVATVIIAMTMTIALMPISRPVRGTTTIIAITAVIIVSIAIVITHQTTQSATN